MADFALVVMTVFAVGVGGWWLGRTHARDQIEFLKDELDAASELADHLLRIENHPSHRARHLRAVPCEGPKDTR